MNSLSSEEYYTAYLKNFQTPYIRYLNASGEFKPLVITYLWLAFFFPQNFNLVDWNSKDLELTNLVIKDLINLNTSWRLLKGYPTHGQRTHSNGKSTKRHKLLKEFRLNQFFTNFGYRKRNIYPTLIICEYTNRLWFLNWTLEWLESALFTYTLIRPNTRIIPFDPVSLAKNFTNGYTRVGAASKLGKSKKITKVATIGFPVYFSQYIYASILPKEFPYTLLISDADRRKMGVKRKKNKKK